MCIVLDLIAFYLTQHSTAFKKIVDIDKLVFKFGFYKMILFKCYTNSSVGIRSCNIVLLDAVPSQPANAVLSALH